MEILHRANLWYMVEYEGIALVFRCVNLCGARFVARRDLKISEMSRNANTLLSTETFFFPCHILPPVFSSKAVSLISLELLLIYDAVNEIRMRSSGVTVALES